MPAIWLSCNRQTYRLNGVDEKLSPRARSCCSALEYSVRTTRPHTSRAHARRLGQLSGAVLTVAGAIGFALANPPPCFAQIDPEASVNDYLPPSEPEVSRDEWRQRIEDARRRSKELSRERRDHPELYKPVPEDPDLVATERLLNDEPATRRHRLDQEGYVRLPGTTGSTAQRAGFRADRAESDALKLTASRQPKSRSNVSTAAKSG